MFDEVTKREGGKRAARKGAYLFGSTAFQVAFIAALIVASEKIRAHVADGPVVDVKFVKSAAPPPPPPPPPPRPKRPPNAPKPPADAPKPVAPPPQAMIQPKDVQEEIKIPTTKPEPEPDYSDGEEGDGDGVVGGVVGAPAGGGIEEAPQYATAGWRPPAMKQRGCVQSSVRIPRELQGYVTSVTVKFGIKPSGEPFAFSVLGAQPDPRIVNAIWQAVSSCEWTPGADAQGKAVAIWVLLPLKFQQ